MTAQIAAATTTARLCRTPRRARGSGRAFNAASSPPAEVAAHAPAGAFDNEVISDDGNAGMAHFGKIDKA
jgi:hypothetical protein